MTERDAMLAAICADPDDDVRRLAFADWLEENGQGERAEFIRVQCEIAGHERRTGSLYITGPEGRRVRELLCRHAYDWTSPIMRGRSHRVDGATVRMPSDGMLEWEVVFRRGFIEKACCMIASVGAGYCVSCYGVGGDTRDGQGECRRCNGTGDRFCPDPDALALVCNHPVTHVVIRDRDPYHNGKGWCWYNADRPEPHRGGTIANIPGWLFRELSERERWQDYPTRELATDALAVAVCRVVRRAAGLITATPIQGNHA